MEIGFYLNEHILFLLYEFIDTLWIAKRKTKWS